MSADIPTNLKNPAGHKAGGYLVLVRRDRLGLWNALDKYDIQCNVRHITFREFGCIWMRCQF